jgi:hypothetical protein
MGEDSFERQNGRFARASDSWEPGVNGAHPGIIMPADPRPGDAYRQEYYPPGKALDEARVLRRDGHMTVRFGTFKRLLVTSEFSPLEPQTEQKYYAPGVGGSPSASSRATTRRSSWSASRAEPALSARRR